MGSVAYATIDDLKAIYKQEIVDEDQATILLEYVSAAIGSLCDTSALDKSVVRLVVCQVCARMLTSQDTGYGISEESWGASPYSGSVKYANPAGDIYLTAFEKRLLGIDKPYLGYINQEVSDEG